MVKFECNNGEITDDLWEVYRNNGPQKTRRSSCAPLPPVFERDRNWKKLRHSSRANFLLYGCQLVAHKSRTSNRNLKQAESCSEEFLWRTVTGDETCSYQYDPTDKTQPKQFSENGLVKAKTDQAKAKVMTEVFRMIKLFCLLTFWKINE